MQVDNAYWSQVYQWERQHKSSEDNYKDRGFWDLKSRNIPFKKRFCAQLALYKVSEISASNYSFCRFFNQVLGIMSKCFVFKNPHLICDRLIISKVFCFDAKGPWWDFTKGVSSLSDLCSSWNVDVLLDDITGLNGISLLPDFYSSSDEIILAFCAIWICSSSLISSFWRNVLSNSSLALFIIFITSVTYECWFLSGLNWRAREH